MPPATDSIAATMFDGLVLKCGSNDEELLRSWVEIRSSAASFLHAAEEKCHSEGLARSVVRALDERILRRANPARTLQVGSTLALPVDVTKPLVDLRVLPDIDRIHCSVSWRTQFIGTVAVPVIAGEVSAAVVRDAIAAAYRWQIIGAFLGETIYSGLHLQVSEGRASVNRNGLSLATWQSTTAEARAELHDRVGWTVFLQELWGRYDWDSSQFYRDLSVRPEVAGQLSLSDVAKQSRRWLQHLTRSDAQHRIRCEIGETLPPQGTPSDDLVEVTLGGALLGCMPIGDVVLRSADDWISAVNRWAGLELCHVAVRELLIGWTGQSGRLRDRLIAREQAAHLGPIHDDARTLRILIGRRSPTSTGLSSSRRAILPAESAGPLLELARRNGEASHVPIGSAAEVKVIEYSPDLLPQQINLPHRGSRKCSVPQSGRTRTSRIDFEAFFARAEDPWGYTNDFERLKYEQTLALLDGMEIGRALELACAEGHFTKMLSPRVAELLATDISEIALQRAAKSCADCRNVSFQRLDLIEDPITGPFDLIVCSEVLYYLEDLAILREVATKLAGALSDGGNLLMANANLVVDEPHCPGRDWGHAFGAKTIEDTFRATEGLSLQKQVLTPLYRIQMFQRGAPSATHEPLTKIAVMANLPPKVSARVLWNGGTALNDRPSGATERLPILMYHRIAPLAAPHRNRYTVTPEAFDQQMRLLSESGAYTTCVEDWHNAMRSRQPLPGKAVLLTFDDGYDNFFEFAWPILRNYGLSATVFVVAGRIGQTSDWSDERAALLSSRRIREVSANGIEIGSHTHTHPSLLTISSERIVHECAESRLALEKLLGRPIKSLAYPYGEVDEAAAHLVGACGYEFAFAVGHRLSTFTDRLLMLPRLEISGLDDFQDFSAKLAAGSL
jgi:peptidoglycan/xylan/chitin deacetylase (PgdA/CDA1 family)